MKFLVYLDDCMGFSAAISRLSKLNRQGWLKASNEGLSFIAKKGDEFMTEVNFTSPFFQVFGAPSLEAALSLEHWNNHMTQHVASPRLLIYYTGGNRVHLHHLNDVGEAIIMRSLSFHPIQPGVFELPARDLRSFYVRFKAQTFSRAIPYLIRSATNVISVTPTLITFTKEDDGALAETYSQMFGRNQFDIFGIDDDEEVTISCLHMTETAELFDFAVEWINVYEICSNMAKVVLEMPIGADATVYTYFA